MPSVRTPQQIEIAYETFGRPRDPAVLLIMGLAAQLVLWDEEFCRKLAERGFYVIRYDNRDVGHSTKMRSSAGPLRAICALISAVLGRPLRPPYTVHDMAGDAVGLLDGLGIRAAHVVGSSMGGIIAQILASDFPERVLSLTSVSSSTGDRSLPHAPMEALARLAQPPPLRRARFIAHTVKLQRFLNGPILPFDEDRARRRGELAFDRGVDIGGGVRHFLALLAAPDRKEALRRVRAPTLVVHGDTDPVSDLACGHDTAASICGAQLLVVPGMGHDLVPLVWDQVIEGIAANAKRAA